MFPYGFLIAPGFYLFVLTKWNLTGSFMRIDVQLVILSVSRDVKQEMEEPKKGEVVDGVVEQGVGDEDSNTIRTQEHPLSLACI